MSASERAARIVRRIQERRADDGWAGVLVMVRDYVAWRRRGSPQALPAPKPPSGVPTYREWISWAQDVAPPTELLTPGIRFSIVCPVHDPPDTFLGSLVRSVIQQSHENWELILVDDGSAATTRDALARHAAAEARIQVVVADQNLGITGATNLGIEGATGDYVVFVDHDDRLAPHALAWLSTAAPEAHLIYSDEDKIDEHGRHSAGLFKPAWSPRMLLAVNYVNHLAAVATPLLAELGGLRPGYEGAQDHDLLLRLSELPLLVAHVPSVLYHWRAWSQSSSRQPSAKGGAEAAGIAAIQDAIDRRGWRAHAATGRGFPFNYRVLFDESDTRPTVKVVVPTRDRLRLLEECVSGLFERTDGVELHLVVIDNGSRDPETLEYLADLASVHDNVIVERVDDAFNYSALCNRGAQLGPQTDYLLFMNNDIRIVHRDWLKQLAGWLREDDDVVAVGPKLLFPDETLQHAGVVLGIKGIAGHVGRGLPDAPRLGHHHDRIHEVGCLTAACLLVRTAAFEAVGGFELTLPVDFQDVDLCLKLRSELGGVLVYDPTYPLIHEESASRGKVGASHPYTMARFRFLWGETVRRGDPYWSPHFSLASTDQELAKLPRSRAELAERMVPRFLASRGWPASTIAPSVGKP